MTVKITDPVSFLKNQVSRRGRSDVDGVYSTGVSVLADALTDYSYGADRGKAIGEVNNMIARQETEWNQILVSTRAYDKDLVHTLTVKRSGENVTICFLTEDHDISCLVFIPKLEVSEFASEVTYYQELLKFVADFAGKNPLTVRFTIGAALIGWEDMVEHGLAKEVEVGW